MSKQPPPPVLKVDLLSSAIAGKHTAAATLALTPRAFTRRSCSGGVIGGFIARNRVLAMFAAGLPSITPLLPSITLPSKRLQPAHRSSQACRLACGSAKCASRLPLNASFAFDPLIRYKVPDVGAVVTQAQDKVSLLPLSRRVTHT